MRRHEKPSHFSTPDGWLLFALSIRKIFVGGRIRRRGEMGRGGGVFSGVWAKCVGRASFTHVEPHDLATFNRFFCDAHRLLPNFFNGAVRCEVMIRCGAVRHHASASFPPGDAFFIDLCAPFNSTSAMKTSTGLAKARAKHFSVMSPMSISCILQKHVLTGSKLSSSRTSLDYGKATIVDSGILNLGAKSRAFEKRPWPKLKFVHRDVVCLSCHVSLMRGDS